MSNSFFSSTKLRGLEKVSRKEKTVRFGPRTGSLVTKSSTDGLQMAVALLSKGGAKETVVVETEV